MKQFVEKKNINRIKTVKGRLKAANNLRRAVKRLLQDGFDPYKYKEETRKQKAAVAQKKLKKTQLTQKKFTAGESFILAYDQKATTWAESTRDSNKIYLNSFLSFLRENSLYNADISEINKQVITVYISGLQKKTGEPQTNTSKNNHRRFLFGIYTQLKQNDIVKYNVIEDIQVLKKKVKKNKPFSKQLLINVLNYTKENDLYLYEYIRFMWYSFLRPVEITRIKVKNISIPDNTIEIKTKTEQRTYILITAPVKEYLQSLDLQSCGPEMFLFSKFGKPSYWKTEKEKSREDFFGRRFKKVKNHFGLDQNYGVYSFRHTAALSLYYKLISDGNSTYQAQLKIQEIMRHKDLNVTKVYLRDIGGELPKDWSKNYDFQIK